jgi:Ohr subfamily peroxiredoxin
LRLVGKRAKANVDGSEVTAEVGLGTLDGGAFGLRVTLRVTLPNLDAAQAQELTATAHQVCPYSNATRGNIDVDLQIA